MDSNLFTDPVLLASELIKFNTTNGVNDEKDCILFVKSLLDEAGAETELIYRDMKRPNLLAKIRSNQNKANTPPLLLYGHLDVVSTEHQQWNEDPFAGTVKNGYLWGRGAIDMKGEHAMFLNAIFRILREKTELPFDLWYLAVSDEEGLSTYGMKYLAEEHKDIFDGIKYGLGEIGGFSLAIAGKKFYPIQVAEKQVAEIEITAFGEGGHASMSHSGTAMEKLARAIVILSTKKLPVRITEPVAAMINNLADSLGGVKKIVLKSLLNKSMTDKILKILGSDGALFDPLLHNSLNVTIVKGGDAINVIPSYVKCRCDLRLVPGCPVEDAVGEIKDLIGEDYQINVLSFDKGADHTDMKLYPSLAAAVKKADPEGYPIPYVLEAVTDGRFLSRINIQSYGFTPMKLPLDYDFTSMAHNADERVPVEALRFGADTVYDYIVNFYEEGINGK